MTDSIRTSYIMNSARSLEILEKALVQLRRLKRENEEVIVVYAGDDEISALRESDSGVDVWIVEKDKGEAHGLNKGLLAARGTVLKALNDEDVFYPWVYHEAIDLCLETSAQVVFVRGKTLDDHGREWEHPAKMEDILNFGSTCGLAVCFRRSLLAEVGLFDLNYVHVDIDFICRLVRSGAEIRSIDKLGFVRHRNSNSNAVRHADRANTERKRMVLNYSGLYFGDSHVSVELIAGIQRHPEFAKWLGAYIEKGLLHYHAYVKAG